MLSIRKPNIFFPGGYIYKQAETGFQLNGNMLLKENARMLLAHRKGNNLSGATLQECINDIVATACRRHPSLCTESKVEVSRQSVALRSGSTVAAPGSARKVRKCGSCGGRKA